MVESKRIWVAKDHDIGYKSKSHMAEFSPNPDGRNKRDTSILEYKRRSKIVENTIMQNRISINKIRNKQDLSPFLEQDEYDLIVEESELEEQNLVDFLISYNLDISLDENLKKFVPLKKEDKYQILVKNNNLYIRLEILSDLLNIKENTLLKKFKNYMKTFDLLPKDEIIQNKNGKYYLISYVLILWMAYQYKINEPKNKLNKTFTLIILEFKDKDKSFKGDLFVSFIEKGYFPLINFKG